MCHVMVFTARRGRVLNTTIDASVLKTLEDRDLWNARGRPASRTGYYAVRSDELARHLNLPEDAVALSLSRLAAQGKVMNIGGTAQNDSPQYHFLHS